MKRMTLKKHRKMLLIASLAMFTLIILFFIMHARGKAVDTPFMQRDPAIEGIEIELIIEPNVAVYYPKTQSTIINDIIYNDVVMPMLEEFKNNVDEKEKNEFYLTYDVYRYNENFISIDFESYAYYANHAHGETKKHTLNFLLDEEKLVFLDDLFASSTYLDIVSEKGFSYLNQNKQFDEEWLKEGLEAKEENFNTFVITEQSIKFFFNPYQVADGSKGIVEFEVELDELQNVLNPDVFIDEIQSPKQPEENINDLKDKKLIALTFDDGPHKTNTPELLDILKEEDVKATFFVLGSMVEYYPEITNQIVEDGHQIGNHTYTHRQLTTLSDDEILQEIYNTKNLIYEITNTYPTAMRPPYGSYDERVKALCDVPIILWSNDSVDWKDKDAQKIRNLVVSNVEDGDIILLHDIHETSIEAAKYIIQDLKNEGYTFVTVETLLAARYGEALPGEVYENGRN